MRIAQARTDARRRRATRPRRNRPGADFPGVHWRQEVVSQSGFRLTIAALRACSLWARALAAFAALPVGSLLKGGSVISRDADRDITTAQRSNITGRQVLHDGFPGRHRFRRSRESRPGPPGARAPPPRRGTAAAPAPVALVVIWTFHRSTLRSGGPLHDCSHPIVLAGHRLLCIASPPVHPGDLRPRPVRTPGRARGKLHSVSRWASRGVRLLDAHPVGATGGHGDIRQGTARVVAVRPTDRRAAAECRQVGLGP